MPNIPRMHHVVPEFYLAGFTMTGERNCQLFVLDQHQRKQWQSTPEQTARWRDFHAIETHSDGDPMVIENTLADIEGKCSCVIRRIVETKELPTGEDLDILLNFVALMAVRVPAIRKTISGFIDNAVKSLTRTMLRSDEGWRQFKRAYDASGQQAEFTREEMKAFVEGGDYTVDFDRSWHVGMMLELGSELIPYLARRKWAIWTAQKDSPDLICSDRPVCLAWYTSDPPPMPPGFGFPDTAVIMPLNRRIAIAGTFEDQPSTFALDCPDVAEVNRSTREYANQIYSSEPDFVWAMTDERVGNANDLLETLRVASDTDDPAVG